MATVQVVCFCMQGTFCRGYKLGSLQAGQCSWALPLAGSFEPTTGSIGTCELVSTLTGGCACRGFCKPGFAFQPTTDVAEVDIVRDAGVDLLHDPLHNKVRFAGMRGNDFNMVRCT